MSQPATTIHRQTESCLCTYIAAMWPRAKGCPCCVTNGGGVPITGLYILESTAVLNTALILLGGAAPPQPPTRCSPHLHDGFWSLLITFDYFLITFWLLSGYFLITFWLLLASDCRFGSSLGCLVSAMQVSLYHLLAICSSLLTMKKARILPQETPQLLVVVAVISLHSRYLA